MFVDLKDNVTRFVVQEYINKIVNAESDTELTFDLHKLVHTFDVVKMAAELVRLSEDELNDNEKGEIIRAALLHDVGRCYEFKEGIRITPCDHGRMGAALIERAFPELKVEIKSTELHNKLPMDTDPKWVYPVLAYVRDADMLGNLAYQIQHMDLFLEHIRKCYPPETDDGFLLNEIKDNIQRRKIDPTPKNVKIDLLNMMLHQVTWIFVLHSRAAFRYAREGGIFSKERDVIIQTVLPILNVTEDQRESLKQQILSLFPDSLFEEEFRKHGI